MALARTRPFQPSRLALVARCALRYLKETENLPEPALPPDTRTLFGRAVHDLVAGRAIRAEDVRTALLDRVGAMLAALDAPLPRWAVGRGLPPSRMVSSSALAAWIRFAILLLDGAPSGSGTRGAQTTRSFGREIMLEDPRHDLAGRADRVDNVRTTTVVTEYKTGRLRLAVGDDHRVQLLAYGLLAAERDARAVELVAISPGDRRELAFDTAARSEIENILREAHAILPRSVVVPQDRIATPGSVCLGCRFRPTCPIYPDWAERHWRDPEVRTPLDVWGDIRRFDARDGLASLVVITSDGTPTRVKGVPVGEDDAALWPGLQVRMMNLNSHERAGGEPRPRNLIAADVARPAESAWNAWFQFGDA